ncbi:MAG: CHRD domain-containing protein [Nitrososphaeraceae archaeon]
MQATNTNRKINGGLVNGTLSTENLEGPLVGKQISELLDLFDMGEAYVNIHTAANPDGEIRGTIQQG